MNTALDSNTAALYAEMENEDRREAAHTRLEQMYPIEDFEEQAWLNFYDPGFCAVQELTDSFPDAVAFALCRFGGNVRGYYTTSQMQIMKDELNVEAWINRWVKEEMERLREERIEAHR